MPRIARSYIEVSRQAVAANYRAIRSAIPAGTNVIGVVKADAYRHGAVEVSRILCAQGAQWLAVSCVEEGVALRASGLSARILVLGGIMQWELGALDEFRLTPVAHSLDDLRRFDECAPLDIHLKIDTGLHRLGISSSPGQVAAAVSNLRHARVEGIMSHFASAGDFSTTQSADQIREFDAFRAALAQHNIRAPLVHLASSSAIAFPRTTSETLPAVNLVRPGIALYGYVSPPCGDAPGPSFRVSPALTWKAAVIEVKDVPAGSTVGYGATYRAPSARKLAVIAAGYADGVQHGLSNSGKVIARGSYAPIVGAVSMDLVTIDVTGIPDLQPGDEVTLIGSEGDVSLDAQDIAATVGTIPYNILCAIGPRVKRFYVD